MRNILESPEVMSAYAQIDLGYLMLKKLQQEISKKDTRHAIEKMIDQQTGFAKADAEVKTNQAIGIMTSIIVNKKFIEADTTEDEAVLKRLVESMK